MITWNNLDTLASFKELEKVERVNLVEAMTGESGAERVKNYSVPMAEGLTYNYAAKQVDDKVLAALAKLCFYQHYPKYDLKVACSHGSCSLDNSRVYLI